MGPALSDGPTARGPPATGTSKRVLGLGRPSGNSNLRIGQTAAAVLLVLLSFYQSIRFTQQASNACDDRPKYTPTPDPRSPREGGERPVQVLYGLHGQSSGFLDQWEVGLKSVLLNAPLDRPLHVHLVVDALAEKAVKERMERARVAAFRARQPVTVTLHNADELAGEWTAYLRSTFRGADFDGAEGDGAYTMGVYYRLLAHRVILPYWNRTRQSRAPGDRNGTDAIDDTINPVLYLDADVVVLAGLDDLWRHVAEDAADETPYDPEGIAEFVGTARASQNRTDPWAGRNRDGFHRILNDRLALAKLTRTPVWQWSSTWPNSGFCIYYLQRMEAFWKLLDALPSIPHTGDQALLKDVSDAFPGIAGVLPPSGTCTWATGGGRRPTRY